MSEEPLKILYIEDESQMLQLVRLILERQGYQFIGALGGQQGLELARKEKPDLILLDLMMPEMDGWEVYRRIQADEELHGTPVIVITAKAQSIDRVLGLHIAKVDAYITKPFDPDELVTAVEKVLAARTGGARAQGAASA